MEEANALWRRKLAEVKQLGASLARMQQRSPDIDPEVWTVLLCRLADDAATAASEPTKICSAGCGLAENASMFSKKQWSARAVRRCLACMKADVEPKLCAHGKGAFDCAACIAIVKREAEAEAAAEAADEEQHDANTKYTEAVVVATKTCAEDAKGQTCYICTQALHWETKEGLVRGCSCPGTAGFAHLSCLAEQAKILMDEAEENNLGHKVLNERWERWHTCGLCEQHYHGAVGCALGWACWKTYLGRPKGSWGRRMAVTLLGNGSGDFDPTDTDGPRLEGVPTGKFCSNCGRDNASKTCGRCMTQVYCSTECQRADWKRHKASCQTQRAAADEEENISPADADQRKTVEESPVFPELKAAIAECANLSLKAAFPDPIRCMPAHVLAESEENMLAGIKEAGLDRPAEGRANLLRRFREALEKDNAGNQRALAEQQAGKIESLVTSIADANPGIAVRDHVKKMIADATQEENRKRRQDKRVKRRTCQICPRAEEITAPRFLVCAGCRKRRYCSEACQETDWLECGHKITCAVVSDFDCRVTPGCQLSERGYCDWCAETFCMDCESYTIAPCANCGRFSCGSSQEHSYGPRGPCPVMTFCDTCGISYCMECRDEHGAFGVLFCDECECSYCEDCREMTFCDTCQNAYCDACQDVESCADCDKAFCADCDPVRKCINCDKRVCTKCSYGNEDIGIPQMCRDCVSAAIPADQALYAAYDTLKARAAADEAGPWSVGERQALSLVVGGLPQPFMRKVWTIMGLEGLPFPDGDDIVNFTLLPDSVCDRAHLCVATLAKAADDYDALVGRVGALEAKP